MFDPIPVLTNTAVFHVLEPVIGVQDASSTLSVLLYPNPGADVIHVEGLTPEMYPVAVSLVDMQGRVLAERVYRSTADGHVAAFRWVGR